MLYLKWGFRALVLSLCFLVFLLYISLTTGFFTNPFYALAEVIALCFIMGTSPVWFAWAKGTHV